MFHRRTKIVVALISTMALAACTGSTSTPVAGNSNAPDSSAAVPSTTSSSAPSSAASAAPSSASAELGQAGAAMANLDSYQAHIIMANGTADLIVIRKPAPAESFTATEAGRKIRVVEIGTTIWVDEGTGTFVKNAGPAGALSGMMSGFDPATMFGAFSKAKLLQYLTPVGSEQKNGVGALRFHGDSSTVGPNGATIPPGGTLDIWVASDGGYLVAFEGHAISGNGATKGDISIEITNINDPANAVSPPN